MICEIDKIIKNLNAMTIRKKKFYVFNIKLQSDKKGDERTQAYEEVIRSLTSVKRFTRLNKNEAITIYQPYERIENGIKYFYGYIGKGISFFDKEEIRVLDNNDITKEVVKKDKILEPTDGEYIFIPIIHRFALISRPNSISIFEFNKFLQEHVPRLVQMPERLLIDFEKEPSIIEEIFKASAVYSLSYEISYSNNDALLAQGELFDELLKENHIGNLHVTAKSDHSEIGMNIENVDFLGGGLEVAKKNGIIKNATIKPMNSDKTRKISNADKPLIQEFDMIDENDNLSLKWFQKLLRIYKPL